MNSSSQRDSLIAAVSQLDWVHKIDLGHGVFTRDSDLHPNIKIVRELLSPIDFRGRACIDIGTRDGGIAFEMEKAGAAPVVATDIEDRPQFRLAHKLLNSNVQYLTDCHVYDLQARLGHIPPEQWDVIVFSGVLYHIVDPLGTLAQIRNLLKPGGLLIVESACIEHEEISMYFNAAGCFYNEPYTFWLPTASCLRYLLRLCSFEPLRSLCANNRLQHGQVQRYALVARAVKPSVAMITDRWLAGKLQPPYGEIYDREINRPLDYQALEVEGEAVDPIPYEKTIEPDHFRVGVMGFRELIQLKLKSYGKRWKKKEKNL